MNPEYVLPKHNINYCSLSTNFLSSILGGTIHTGKSNIDHFKKYIENIIRTADDIERLTRSLISGAEPNVNVTIKRADYAKHSALIKKLVEYTRSVMTSMGVIENEYEVRKTAELILANKNREAVQHTKTLLIEGGIYTAISIVYDKFFDIHRTADLLFSFTEELVNEMEIESASISYMAIFRLILQSNQIYTSITLRLAEAVKKAFEKLEFATLQEEQHRKIQATFLFLKKMIPLGVTKIVWGQPATGKHLKFVWCIQNKFSGDFLYPTDNTEIHFVHISYPTTQSNIMKFETIPVDDKFYIKNFNNREYLAVQYLLTERNPRRRVYTTLHKHLASLWTFEPINFDEFYIQTQHNGETSYLFGPLSDSRQVFVHLGKDPANIAKQMKPSQLFWILKKCF